jgi:hypothetical protein
MKSRPDRQPTIMLIVLVSLLGCNSVRDRQTVFPNAPAAPAGIDNAERPRVKTPSLEIGGRPEPKTRPTPVDVPMLRP